MDKAELKLRDMAKLSSEPVETSSVANSTLTGRDRGFWIGRWHSFTAALNGARYTILTQPNAWIELTAFVVIISAGIYFRVTSLEWAILALTAFSIVALEAVNTAVEATVDLVTTEYHPMAKIAKDSAAGALVFGVLGSIGVAMAIFGPRLWHLLMV